MWEIFFWLFLFIGGYLIIYFAADVFLDNLKDFCLTYNISPFVIGLLVLGIDPEESIASIMAALNDLPLIAVGNVIGNSILSLTLCFALAVFFYKIKLTSISVFYFLILYSCMIAILLSFIVPFGLFIFGFITLFFYIVYLLKSLKDISKKGKIDVVDVNEIIEDIQESGELRILKYKKILLILFSLLFIILGGELLIFSTDNLIKLTGIAEEFFGFIIIAFVTNVEELTLIFKSIRRKSMEIGLGGMIGKITWNLSLTYGISAVISINITISPLLVLNWLILLLLIIYFQIKSNKEPMGKADGVILITFLTIFSIINFLSI